MPMQERKKISPERAARVTINDLAAALDLTKSTVSRAMNGYPDISEATQLRVRRMASAMNYQPLSHAQAIKTGLTRSLGIVLQLSDHDAHRPFLAEFLAGVSAGASTEGYTLTVASADTHDDLISNFGALKQDLDKASLIVELKTSLGFPHSFATSWSKKHSRQVQQIALLLHRHQLLPHYQLALQTLTPEALRVRRILSRTYARKHAVDDEGEGENGADQ